MKDVQTKDVNDNSSHKNLKRKKGSISEKRRRHISRLLNLIEGEKALPSFLGRVNKREIKIRFDHRGEFNIITKLAMNKIETNEKKLERLRESENIPVYLKRERKVRFKATKVELTIFDSEITVEAMILDAREMCLMLGRKTCKEIGRRKTQRKRRPPINKKGQTYVE